MPEPGLIYTREGKLNEAGGSLSITIPAEWVKAHNLKGDDKVRITIAKRLIIEAIDPPDEDDA